MLHSINLIYFFQNIYLDNISYAALYMLVSPHEPSRSSQFVGDVCLGSVSLGKVLSVFALPVFFLMF